MTMGFVMPTYTSSRAALWTSKGPSSETYSVQRTNFYLQFLDIDMLLRLNSTFMSEVAYSLSLKSGC